MDNPRRFWLDELIQCIEPCEVDISKNSTRRLSRDSYWQNPMLKQAFHSYFFADAVVVPKSVEDVVRINKAAYHLDIPVTPRGNGTGIKAFVLPFHGGLLMDMRHFNREIFLDNETGILRCEACRSIGTIEDSVRLRGWEMRILPATIESSIAGFFAGHVVGIGSINFGKLGNIGNIRGIQLVTLEREPRVLELRDPSLISGIMYSGGTCGIITSLEIALSPAQNWVDLIIAFSKLESALKFSTLCSLSSSLQKRNISFVQWPLSGNLGISIPEGHHVVSIIAASSSIESLEYEIKKNDGKLLSIILSSKQMDPALCALSWSQITTNSIRFFRQEDWTYLEIYFPIKNYNKFVDLMVEVINAQQFEQYMHIEFVVDSMGGLMGVALPLVRCTAALQEIMDYFTEIFGSYTGHPPVVMNPNVCSIKPTGDDEVDEVKKQLRKAHDTKSLLNPGKL